MMIFSISSAKGDTQTREETVKILQQKYVTVLDEQHKSLLAIKIKMKTTQLKEKALF